MRDYLSEILLGLGISLLAALLWNPFWMPMGFVLMALCILVGLYSAFVTLWWRELKRADEREKLHTLMSDRIAFIAGTVMLLGIVVYETLRHGPSAKMAAVILAVMVLAKILGFIYGKSKY